MLIGAVLSSRMGGPLHDDLAPALRDPRYITVDGDPLLVIYRPGEIRRGAEAIKRLRQRAKRDGFGQPAPSRCAARP